ncbi:MAG: beta-N-acetylhexosaminidase [Lachnospiraceae bacterium]|nr:beta-N-acetylhexosaminidase [Lachnospiraceae bacterium]
MELIVRGDNNQLKEAVDEWLKQEKDLDVSRVNLEVDIEIGKTNQLVVHKKDNKCEIKAAKQAHVIRALSFLLEHIDEVEFDSTEDVIFETNGVMVDCSRNAVLRLSKIKEIIRKMATLGLDSFMLYTEDTYEVEGHPYFGAYRGRYTQAELKAVDDYAYMFGIEVIPCIQTLAHLHNVLKWPEFVHLQDNRDIIKVGNEDTYRLLKDMITSASKPFRTKQIHLGMDEAIALGLGNYLRENGYRKTDEIMAEHMERVFEICKELGLKPMIWSDMYITANSAHYYYDTPKDVDTANWKKPPNGLGLVYWDYYHHDENVYSNNLKAHLEISDNVFFAGGSWIWAGVAPNLEKAVDASINGLEVCRKIGVKNVISTHWLDNGSETPIEASYPIMTLYAEYGFGHFVTAEEILEGLCGGEITAKQDRKVEKSPNKQHLEKAFTNCFGGVLDDYLLLGLFDHIDPDNKYNQWADTPSKFLLYQDAIIGIFDKQTQGYDLRTHYLELKYRLEKALSRNKSEQKLFEYYLLLANVLSIKADLGIRMKKAYDKKDNVTLLNIANNDIRECCEFVEKMKLKREEIWNQDCKMFGYELLDIRIGAIATRLMSISRRLQAFAQGDVEEIEELEEKRLLYQYIPEDRKRRLCGQNFWQRIISGCDLDDTI